MTISGLRIMCRIWLVYSSYLWQEKRITANNCTIQLNLRHLVLPGHVFFFSSRVTASTMSVLSVLLSARFDRCDAVIFPFAPVDTAPERILSQVESLHHRRCSSPMVVHAVGLFAACLVHCLGGAFPSLSLASTSSGGSWRSDRLTFPAFGFPSAPLGLGWWLAPAASHSRRFVGPHHGRNVAVNDVILLIGGACVLVMRRRRPRRSLIATFVLPLRTRWSEFVNKFSEGFAYYRRGALTRGLRTLAVRWGRDIGCKPRSLIQLFVRRRAVSCAWRFVQRGQGWGRRRRGPVCMLIPGRLHSLVVFIPRIRLVLLLEHPTPLCETCENDKIYNRNVRHSQS